MTLYNVHLYREMRLLFPGIEAETPEAAASIALERPTDEANLIDDCEGETLAALVDVVGDEEYQHSVTIDFEAERSRKAASKLLTSLSDLLAEIDGLANEFSICEEISVGDSGRAARAVLAEAEAAGIRCHPSPEPDADEEA